MAKKATVLPEGASLFERLFAENDQTLTDQNKEFLAEELKMAIRAGINGARRQTNKHKQDLNALRANLQTYDLTAILDLKAEITSFEEEIKSAREEYAVMFGEEMPDSI